MDDAPPQNNLNVLRKLVDMSHCLTHNQPHESILQAQFRVAETLHSTNRCVHFSFVCYHIIGTMFQAVDEASRDLRNMGNMCLTLHAMAAREAVRTVMPVPTSAIHHKVVTWICAFKSMMNLRAIWQKTQKTYSIQLNVVLVHL